MNIIKQWDQRRYQKGQDKGRGLAVTYNMGYCWHKWRLYLAEQGPSPFVFGMRDALHRYGEASAKVKGETYDRDEAEKQGRP